MIDYNPKAWSIRFLVSIRGSVFPAALTWAVPNSIAAILLFLYLPGAGKNWDVSRTSVLISYVGYNFILGFLIVFRTQQAYSRYWEGASLLQQVRGEWFNAVSSLFSFCSPYDERRKEVEYFQNVVVRLMSLLFCSALKDIAVMEDEDFDIIDSTGIDRDSLRYMASCPEPCEIILQWIQRLIVDNMRTTVIDIPPPVLSRVFQELSRGIVNVNSARKITNILFPFPYAQIIAALLWIQSIITPFICCQVAQYWWQAGIASFMAVFLTWSVNYVAVEIEMPFGDDPNDLPVADMQRDMNISLLALMDPRSQIPPNFERACAGAGTFSITTWSAHIPQPENVRSTLCFLEPKKSAEADTDRDSRLRHLKMTKWNRKQMLILQRANLRNSVAGKPRMKSETRGTRLGMPLHMMRHSVPEKEDSYGFTASALVGTFAAGSVDIGTISEANPDAQQRRSKPSGRRLDDSFASAATATTGGGHEVSFSSEARVNLERIASDAPIPRLGSGEERSPGEVQAVYVQSNEQFAARKSVDRPSSISTDEMRREAIDASRQTSDNAFHPI